MAVASPPVPRLEEPTAEDTRSTGARGRTHGLSPAREAALVAGTYVAYSIVRNLTRSESGRAFDNAQQLIDLQRRLGVDIELVMHTWTLSHLWLVGAANYFYSSATFVVTPLTLVFLYRRFPHEYRRLRRSLAFLIGFALLGYVAFPLMPPRLLDRLGDGTVHGFTDTLARYPAFWSFASGTVDSVTNQFAAMPSLHCAFAVWTAWVLVPRCRTRWARGLAIAYPWTTVTVVIVTANHYVLDAVGGALVVALGAGAASLSARWWPPRTA